MGTVTPEVPAGQHRAGHPLGALAAAAVVGPGQAEQAAGLGDAGVLPWSRAGGRGQGQGRGTGVPKPPATPAQRHRSASVTCHPSRDTAVPVSPASPAQRHENPSVACYSRTGAWEPQSHLVPQDRGTGVPVSPALGSEPIRSQLCRAEC